MSSLWVNEVKHHTTGFNNVVQFTDGAGTENGTLCRAWVNFNGTLVTNPGSATGIRASFNVSSVTDNGTGDYTVTLANAMPDANYAVATCCSHETFNTAHPSVAMSVKYDVAPTTTTCRFRTGPTGGANSGGFALDAIYANVVFFR
jgi:hypothetical protein